MRRGEVWTARLDPAESNEANKTRPVVIVSSDTTNRAAERVGRGVITVVPLTSNTARVRSFEALIPADAGNGLPVDSKAQPALIRAIDTLRLIHRLGALRVEQVAAINDALLTHLALDGWD